MMNSRMRKILLLTIVLICLFILSGCSFSDLMSKGTGITSDPDYQTWEKLSDGGKLDSEGKYTADAVHVTFAENNYLEAHYFSNPEKTEEFPDTGCYLLPGEKIYYSVKEKKSSRGLFVFDRLEVYEYENGNRQGALNWITDTKETSVMVPYDFKGTEVSVEPSGHFGDRTMIFRDFTEDGKKVNGSWYVNNDVVSEEKFTAHPLENYVVEYRYDSDKYYFIKSEPEYWKADFSDGLVVFSQSRAKTGMENYSVELAPYVSAEISIENDANASVKKVSDEKVEKNNARRNWTVYKIREGSSVTVETSSANKYNIHVNCSINETIGDPEEIEENGRKKYRYTVNFGDMDRFMFIPTEYGSEHGKIRYYCNDREITEKVLLNSGMTIECVASDIENGYWFPDGGTTVVVSGSDTADKLRDVRIYPYRKVSVLFDQPAIGGTVYYSINGKMIEGVSADLYCGTRIDIELKAENGWNVKSAKKSVYTVTESNNQVVSFNDQQVSIQFIEAENHKPELSIEFKNAGKGKLTVNADGYFLKEKPYNGNKFEDETITMRKIGTGENVILTFDELSLPKDKATLKITVEKKAVNENEPYRNIFYVTSNRTPHYVTFARNKTYESLKIIVEAIKTANFQPLYIENALFEAQFADLNPDEGEAGNIIESGYDISNERMIKVTVRPQKGYYMTGADTNNDIYEKQMSYGDYRKLKAENLQKQLRKIYHITLDTNDNYGIVKYWIKNQETHGTVEIREGDVIRMVFTLKEECRKDYEIEGELGVFTLNWAKQIFDDSVFYSREQSVPFTPDMGGKTIKRDTYIKIKRKGE